MSQFSAEIRRTPEWWTRFTEHEVRKQWAASALERTWKIQTPSQQVDVKLSQHQVSGLNYLRSQNAGFISHFRSIMYWTNLRVTILYEMRKASGNPHWSSCMLGR